MIKLVYTDTVHWKQCCSVSADVQLFSGSVTLTLIGDSDYFSLSFLKYCPLTRTTHTVFNMDTVVLDKSVKITKCFETNGLFKRALVLLSGAKMRVLI